MKNFYVTFFLEDGQHGIRTKALNEKTATEQAITRINEILHLDYTITEDDICDIDIE